MRHLFSIFFILLLDHSYAQERPLILIHETDTLVRANFTMTDYDSAFFLRKEGDVFSYKLGGDTTEYYKIVKFQYKNVINVSHIYLDPLDHGGEEATSALADTIISKIKRKQNNFTTLNFLYRSDESNELGYFFEDVMVKEFNDPIFAAKKGDLLKVKTKFGYHVVYINESPRKEKFSVVYNYLVVKQNN